MYHVKWRKLDVFYDPWKVVPARLERRQMKWLFNIAVRSTPTTQSTFTRSGRRQCRLVDKDNRCLWWRPVAVVRRHQRRASAELRSTTQTTMMTMTTRFVWLTGVSGSSSKQIRDLFQTSSQPMQNFITALRGKSFKSICNSININNNSNSLEWNQMTGRWELQSVYDCAQTSASNISSNAVFAAWLSGKDVGLWQADFPWSTPDMWLTCDHFVDKVFAMGQLTRPTQHFHHFGSSVSSNPHNYMDYWGEDY